MTEYRCFHCKDTGTVTVMATQPTTPFIVGTFPCPRCRPDEGAET